ncbi:MAG: MoaD/ThiS family protein [Candidatus Heimdallarchaeaceae archaeon]
MKVYVIIRGIFNRQYISYDSEIKLKNDATLKKLIVEIRKRIHFDFIYLIESKLSNPVIMLNGNSLNLLEDLSTILKEDDEVIILQSLGGG